jgi:acyl transferase domain-containing protein
VLVLQRLSDAVRAGRRIWAVVRGSAVNQDGASNGLTAPNGPSQERVIRAALAAAGLSTTDVDVVEAHGTGTRLGDPIEAQALLATYGQGREQDRPLWLGSVKSNIGHTQAAAGLAGVIKMVMAMRAGILPATLHVDEASPLVDWSTGGVCLLTSPRSWPEDRVRRAGVSGFGISGTNAHVLLEQPPTVPEQVSGGEGVTADAPVVWRLSGRSAQAVGVLADRLCDVDVPVGQVAAGLAARAVLPVRAVVVGRNRRELVDQLRTVAPTVVGSTARVAVVFTGQGAQWPGMGRGLADTFPLFDQELARVCGLFDQQSGGAWPGGLQHIMYGEAQAEARVVGGLSGPWLAQCALVAFEVALWRLLRSWGLSVVMVAGHSVGELVAAWAAETVSLADLVTVVAERGRLMAGLPAGGVMWAVQAQPQEIPPGIPIAAINAPHSLVLSGTPDTLHPVLDQLRGQGRRVRQLQVGHAYHSPLMDPILDQFATIIAGTTWQPPTLPCLGPGAQAATNPHTWVEHLRQPVDFLATTHRLIEAGITHILEIGPDTTLIPLIAQTLTDPTTHSTHPTALSIRLRPLQHRDRDPATTLLHHTSQLWATGIPINWHPTTPTTSQPVPLPSYPFHHHTYWPNVPGRPASRRVRREVPVDARQRLLTAPPGQRQENAVDLVRQHAGAVLGYAPEDLPVDRPFTELGLTSITAVELRSGLEMAGLPIAATAVYDHSTATTLASHLLDRLEHADESIVDDDAIDEPPLVTLFRRACESGRMEHGIDLLDAAARLRDPAAVAAEEAAVVEAYTFSQGTGATRLICLPSLVAPASPVQFSRFAEVLRGRHDVIVLEPTGYDEKGYLPDTLAAAVRVHAAAVRRAADGKRVALVGYSSGGWLAHAVAASLGASGDRAGGVILLDTYLPGDARIAALQANLFRELVGQPELIALLNDARLAAMGRYLSLFRGWVPRPLASPVLLVSAERFTDTEAGHVNWPAPYDHRMVAATHISIIGDFAVDTAEAVQQWLAPDH